MHQSRIEALGSGLTTAAMLGQQKIAAEHAARAEEIETVLRGLLPLRKLRPAVLAQRVEYELVEALSHRWWVGRECAMELLAKCPPAALAPAVPAMLQCVDAPYTYWSGEADAMRRCKELALQTLASKKLVLPDAGALAPYLGTLRGLLRGDKSGFGHSGEDLSLIHI